MITQSPLTVVGSLDIWTTTYQPWRLSFSLCAFHLLCAFHFGNAPGEIEIDRYKGV